MTDPIPTTDRIRHDITRGAASDKINFPDPAMAPLGTDSEAAGFTPTRAERRLEAARLGPIRDRVVGGILGTWLGYGAIIVALALALAGIVLAGLGVLH